MRKGPLLAEGRTAEIYAWGEDQVVKLYRPGFPTRDAEYEYNKALASQETGFAVPLVGEVVTIEGRVGITYQRVEGITMMEAIQKMPWRLFPLTRQLVALQVDMHSRKAANLPDSHDVLAYKINHASPLDDETKGKIIGHLDNLPRDDKLLHGDFHPGNILLTPNGPVIIDWIDATVGHPLADVARTSLLARVSSSSPSNALERLMALLGRLFHRNYIEHYFKLSPYEERDLQPWLLPVTAGRLSEDIPHERDALIGLVMEYLDRVN